jgi:hypothetical protein
MVIRGLFTFITLFALKFLFQGGEVKMNLNSPGVVDAGKSFKVTVTLTKSQVSGFSRFAQEIPVGLTATSLSTANADFTFKDNRVRFIWLKLPDSDTFTVAYEVKVDERLKGTFELGGKFSFIDKNERKTIDLQGKQITITPSPNIDPKLIVDIKDFKDRVIPQLIPVDVENVACVRQKPDLTFSDKEILVNILVNKGSRQKFAKIEEKIPAGYVAVALEKKDAIFAFRDQTAKFLWMTLPAETYFTVSYKLVPQNKQKVDSLPITGNFSYIDGQKNSSVPIYEEDVNLEKVSKEQLAKILSAIPGFVLKPEVNTGALANKPDTSRNKDLALNTTVPDKNIKANSNTNQQNTTNTNKVPDTRNVKNVTADNSGSPDKNATADKTKNSDKNLTSDKNKNNTSIKNVVQASDTSTKSVLLAKTEARDATSFSYILEPETGVYYRVQIAAGHKPIGLRQYFRKLTFNQDIKTEQHLGWYKYSIGSWNEYKQARDFRLHVWNTTPIKDAFVAAYNGGKRITVQEALMVSNQKWYR